MEFSAEGRHNFSSNKGSAEFGLTFPLWGKLRGYATAFTGYGESLIDYNYSQTRFGLGIALNNVL
jgi:phospholipase A1